jgi:hypothetical protein
MRGKMTLFIDQWGHHWFARTVADLRAQIGRGGSRVSKMYVDGKAGGTFHVGYVIGEHWLKAFQAVRNPA